MTNTDSERIAALTTGAIKTTTESANKALLAAVEAAEEKTREMRAIAEQHIAESERMTGTLAENINAHVTACQALIDSFQGHHLKILNVDPPAVNGRDPEVVARVPSEETKE